MNTVNQMRKELKRFSSKKKAALLQGFFKTGPGEYGEGDIFIGVKVPEVRSIAKKFISITRNDICTLLHSNIHEERLLALLILIMQFNSGDKRQQRSIYLLYMKNTRYINNWDLVDLTAPAIVGAYLMKTIPRPLYTYAVSASLWERRIAIVATHQFIRNGEFAPTLRIARCLLNDTEDLIHKATGWMLREVGKRNQPVEEEFLRKWYNRMPRTMLRYAIERFPEKKRKAYLLGCM